jgi:hypothetical protein
VSQATDALRTRGQRVVGCSRTLTGLILVTSLALTVLIGGIPFATDAGFGHVSPAWWALIVLATPAVPLLLLHRVRRDELRAVDAGLLACRRRSWRLVPWSEIDALAWACGSPGGPVVRTSAPRSRFTDDWAYLCRPARLPWEQESAAAAVRGVAESRGIPFCVALESEHNISLAPSALDHDGNSLDQYRVE